MLSEIVGPTQLANDAICDLGLLIRGGPEMYRDWLNEKITRLVIQALDEASRARAPRAGLSLTDYAQAVGEVIGAQRMVAALQHPEQFLERLGVATGPAVEKLPPAAYAAPEPPPAITKA